MHFGDIGGWTSKFWGVLITPNFLPRKGTNRKYFLFVENIKRISIKNPLYTMALFVLVLELPGGRTFELFAKNLWPRSFAFLTNFRRIDFRINLFIDAHCWVLSNFETKFQISVFMLRPAGPKVEARRAEAKFWAWKIGAACNALANKSVESAVPRRVAPRPYGKARPEIRGTKTFWDPLISPPILAFLAFLR